MAVGREEELGRHRHTVVAHRWGQHTTTTKKKNHNKGKKAAGWGWHWVGEGLLGKAQTHMAHIHKLGLSHRP